MAPDESKMTLLERTFCFYAEYHWNAVNQWIHIVFVPTIFLTALVMLTNLDVSGVVPPSVLEALTPVLAPLHASASNAAWIVALAYIVWYLVLSPSLGVLAGAMIAALFFGASLWAEMQVDAWKGALVVHVVAWIAQFYGHGVHEKRSPALLDNLFLSLFMAPIFILLEVLFKMGMLREFHAKVASHVEERIAAFRSGAAADHEHAS